MSALQYRKPIQWLRYDPSQIAQALAEAKSAILSLQTVPYQRSWVEHLQRMELKREVAGTSRIEGAEFTERELDAALRETPEQLKTRSQRQAHAAMLTYRWIASIPHDRPLDARLLLDIHRRIVTDADDDHCPPGRIRHDTENVTFGNPRHRGVPGGKECGETFHEFALALQREFRGHDPLIQALAAHYHLAAMHAFLDGNGRTSRALEALLLQRAGLKDSCFISMSNYYYDEKPGYLAALNTTWDADHDLTSFLAFALRGVASQSRRLLDEINAQVSKALFRNLMHELHRRLKTSRSRVIMKRQMEILNLLLESEALSLEEIVQKTWPVYRVLKSPDKAVVRDLFGLLHLEAVRHERSPEGTHLFSARLDWPTRITETVFFQKWKTLPKAKTLSSL